jgi:hypothetical protein
MAMMLMEQAIDLIIHAGDGLSDYIAPGQAFFIAAASSSSIIFHSPPLCVQHQVVMILFLVV